MSRTRVPRWNPPFWQALRLVARPAIVYAVFTIGGLMALIGSAIVYDSGPDRDLIAIVLGCVASVAGMLVGMFVGVTRIRVLPVTILMGISVTGAGILIAATSPPGGKEVAIALLFFCLSFPCGILSLQHRYELLASFWPACGWIGAVFLIINHEGRVTQWEQDKVTAWQPVPLFFLGCFLVLWLFYLAAKQAMRVELWQALSGAVGRRVTKKSSVGAIPRRNVLPMLVVSVLLFGLVALLAPYLWRTGKGDHESKGGGSSHEQTTQSPSHGGSDPGPGPGRSRGSGMDGEAIGKQLAELASAAKNTLLHLWPLLLLFLFYRPAKRALLQTHLLTPIVPTPPTERIDNNWEYVRIAAEDAGVVPAPSDSVEQLLVRIQNKGLGGPALAGAAAIYARTRYGFTVERGDPIIMRKYAIDAGQELRAELGPFTRVKNLFRRLS